MAHQPEVGPVEGKAGRAVAGRKPRRHAQAHRVDADQRAVGVVGNPDGARERPEVDAGSAQLDVPGDPVRRRRDPVDGRSVAGQRPDRAFAGRDRPGLDRERDARDDLAARDPLDAPLRSAHHPGGAEAEREPVLRVRDRRAAADADGSGARQRRDRRREREHATVRRGTVVAPTRVESLQRPARGRRSTTRKRPGATRVERKRRGSPLEGRALTVGACLGAGRTTSVARHAVPAEGEPAEPTAARGSREREDEGEQGRHGGECSTELVLLTTTLVPHAELAVRSAPCRSSSARRPRRRKP